MKLCVLGVSLLFVLSPSQALAAAAPAPAPAPVPASKPVAAAPKEQYANGAKVDAIFGYGAWKSATVKNRDGDVYLVAFDPPWDKQSYWTWVHISMVRPVGGDKAAPRGQMGVRVGSKPVATAKAEAMKAFAGRDAAPQPDNVPVAGKGPVARPARSSPFDPKPYDKPVAVADVSAIAERNAAGAAARSVPPAPFSARIVPRSIVLQMGTVRGLHETQLAFADAYGIAVGISGSTTDPKSIHMERLNLTTGAIDAMMEWELKSAPIAISPTGQRVLSRAVGFFPGQKNRVDIWNLTGAPLAAKHLISFEPYKGKERGDSDVEWAILIDDTHALICSGKGELVMWEISDTAIKGIWRLAGGVGHGAALSPSRKHVALMSASGLIIVDVATGSVLSQIVGGRTANGLSWSPDGKIVAGMSSGVLTTWDVEKGTFGVEIGLPPGVSGSGVDCVNEGFVLLGDHYLLDLATKQVVWKYEGAGKVTTHAGRAWATVTDAQRVMLVPAELPTDAARKAAKANAANADANLLIKPGATVSLDIQLSGSQEQIKSATDAINAQLKQAGIKIADNQPVKVAARTEDGKTIERKWQVRNFGPGAGLPTEETVSVTEKITRFYVESDGKVAWEVRSVNAPSMVSRKEGQSVADAVAAANQYNLQFLQTVRLPQYVLKPREPLEYGKSTWLASGVRDGK
jgi:hypothetical protein